MENNNQFVEFADQESNIHEDEDLNKEIEENVIYIDSFFIPHVSMYISLDELVNILETTDGGKGIGLVEKIESIPKQNKTDGHLYYSAFVFLKEWNDNAQSKYVRNNLYEDKQVKLYYNDYETNLKRYFLLLPNKSSTTEEKDPEHFDLMLCNVHNEISCEYIYNVLLGLDIGKVMEINWFPHENQITNSNVWKYANIDIWNSHIKQQDNIVCIHFDYWYKTKTACKFQEEIKNNSLINIPIGHNMYLTFYKIQPKYEGVNPYVWQRFFE